MHNVLSIAVLCCLFAPLQSLPIKANRSFPYWWPKSTGSMRLNPFSGVPASPPFEANALRMKSGDDFIPGNGFQEFCLSKLVNALRPYQSKLQSQTLFPTNQAGFVVSAGPPPKPEEVCAKDPDNCVYATDNYQYYYHGTLCSATGGQGALEGAECEKAQDDSLSVRLNNECPECEAPQVAEGFYEGSGEKSYIVALKAGQENKINTVAMNFMQRYKQDSVLYFQTPWGSEQKRDITLAFGSLHKPMFLTLGTLKMYLTYAEIPKGQRFAYTEVQTPSGKQYYAGVGPISNYISCFQKP